MNNYFCCPFCSSDFHMPQNELNNLIEEHFNNCVKKLHPCGKLFNIEMPSYRKSPGAFVEKFRYSAEYVDVTFEMDLNYSERFYMPCGHQHLDHVPCDSDLFNFTQVEIIDNITMLTKVLKILTHNIGDDFDKNNKWATTLVLYSDRYKRFLSAYFKNKKFDIDKECTL